MQISGKCQQGGGVGSKNKMPTIGGRPLWTVPLTLLANVAGDGDAEAPPLVLEELDAVFLLLRQHQLHILLQSGLDGRVSRMHDSHEYKCP